jgi:hypothetical protein
MSSRFKRLLAALAVLVMLLAITACGSDSDSNNDTVNPADNNTETPNDNGTETPDDNGTEIPDDNITGTLPERTLDEFVYVQDVEGTPADVDVSVTDNGSILTPAPDAIYYDNSTYSLSSEESDDDTLVFTGTGLTSPDVGDIVFGISPDGQSGFLRKVTAVTSNTGSRMVLETEPATIQEAFPNSELDFSMNFSNTSGTSGERAAVNMLNIERELAYEFYDGVKTVMELSVNSDFTVNLNLRLGLDFVDKLKTVVSSQMAASIVLDADLAYELTREYTKEFGPLFDRNFIVPVSGFPVLVNVKVVPVMGADLGLNAETTFKYGFSADTSFNAGFDYVRGAGVSKIRDYTYNYSKIGPEYSLEGAASAEVYASLAVQVSLYEVSLEIPLVGEFEIDGPGVGVDVTPSGKFSVSAEYDQDNETFECALDLSVGISSDAAVDYGGFGEFIGAEDPSFELFSMRRSVWASSECPFEGAKSSLSGYVTDNESVELSGVAVKLTSAANQSHTATTDADGEYSFDNISTGIYGISFTKTGFEQVSGTARIGQDPVSYGRTEMIPVMDNITGTLLMSVRDASRPTEAVPNAAVLIKNGNNNPFGNFVKRIFADSYGTATTTLPAGYYTAEIVKDSYETTYESFNITGGTTAVTALLSSTIDDDNLTEGTGGEARIVLTWGAAPTDLDSHLTWSDSSGSHHIWYSGKTDGNASLDVDDVTSYGPETITIGNVDTTTTYNYYVHNFSGESSMGQSDAVVKLYYGGTQRTYNVPGGDASIWNVFSIENGRVISSREKLSTYPKTRSGQIDKIIKSFPPKN